MRLRSVLCLCLALAFLLAACRPLATSTPFIPPTHILPAPSATPASVIGFTPPPDLPSDATAAPQSTLEPSPTPSGPCVNSLRFVQDLTVPDGSIYGPGDTIDKRWQVENNGTCDWDSTYSLRLVNGSEMGAPTVQALYPARSSTQVIIEIAFKAPAESGIYQSEWQAYGPDGLPFGETVFLQISVQLP